MNNPPLNEKKFDIYFFLFNSKQLLTPDDNSNLGKEGNEEFINIIIDIHNDKNVSFHQLLIDKEKESNNKE